MNDQNNQPKVQQQKQQIQAISPKKESEVPRKFKSNYCKFKQINTQNSYIPKLKQIPSKSSQLSLGYIYKTDNVEDIGNLEQWSDSKPNNNLEQKKKKVQIISESKKKGIKDYTISLKRNQQSQGDASSIFVVASSPFKNQKFLNYFQIKILDKVQNSNIPKLCFGIVNGQDNPLTSKNNICLYSKITQQNFLQIYRNCNKIEEINNIEIKVGDSIGFGFIHHRNEAFIVLNKDIVLHRIRLYVDQPQEQPSSKIPKSASEIISTYNRNYYPFLIVQSKKISLELIFENSYLNFCFNYKQYVNQTQQTFIQQEVPICVNMSEQSVYGLVLNYFKFNGFDKSSQSFEAEMISRNMKVHQKNEPLKNQLQYSKKYDIMKEKKGKKIIKKSRLNRRDFYIEPYENFEINSQPQRINLNNGNQEDDEENDWSSSSDDQVYLNESLSKRLQKKNLQNNQIHDQRMQIQRKKKHQKMQKKIQLIKKTDEQKCKIDRICKLYCMFRNSQKYTIRENLIKSQNIFKIVQEIASNLKIFRSLLQSSHIFKDKQSMQNLVLIKEGLKSALQYAKKEHITFSRFENYLMPFFNMKSIADKEQSIILYRPLREILFVICPEDNEQFCVQKQFEVFAQFMSKVICQQSGFFGCSKLQLVLDYFNVVQRKIAEFQIPIGGIDLEQMELL